MQAVSLFVGIAILGLMFTLQLIALYGVLTQKKERKGKRDFLSYLSRVCVFE